MFKPAATAALLLLTAAPLYAHEGHDHTKAWNSPPGAAARPNPMSPSPENIAAGKKLYDQFCTQCHGQDGTGNPAAKGVIRGKPSDLSFSAAHHPAGDLFWKVRNGRGAMPNYKLVFTKQQVWEMVTYIQSLAPTQ